MKMVLRQTLICVCLLVLMAFVLPSLGLIPNIDQEVIQKTSTGSHFLFQNFNWPQSPRFSNSELQEIFVSRASVTLELTFWGVVSILIFSFLWLILSLLSQKFHTISYFIFEGIIKIPTLFLILIFFSLLEVESLKFLFGDWPTAFWDSWRHKVLPVFFLMMRPLASFCLIVEQQIVRELKEGYVQTARAKGVAPFKIIFSHVIRNGLPVVLTHLSVLGSRFIVGGLLVEILFSIPGLSQEMLKAWMEGDDIVLFLILAFYIIAYNIIRMTSLVYKAPERVV